MLDQDGTLPDSFDDAGMLRAPPTLPGAIDAEAAYIARYQKAFSAHCLSRQTIGVYGHSAVGRDILVRVLESLGARVVQLAWSQSFVPVDTEAIRPEDIKLAKKWATERPFDAIVSTDGDSDRPLLADEKGVWCRGDVLGVIAARYVKAHTVVTPVSSNSLVELCGFFARVERTQIGSPFVIEAMQRLAKDSPSVVAYEANGGFLVQSELHLVGGVLSPLPTRDAILPLLCALDAAASRGIKVSRLIADLPARYTTSDRLKDIATDKSQSLLARLQSGGLPAMSAFLQMPSITVDSINTVDGLRMHLSSGDVVHVRPSGNAPELRCYVESATEAGAARLLALALDRLQRATS
jgi:phosphomannomutase